MTKQNLCIVNVVSLFSYSTIVLCVNEFCFWEYVLKLSYAKIMIDLIG